MMAFSLGFKGLGVRVEGSSFEGPGVSFSLFRVWGSSGFQEIGGYSKILLTL